MASCFDRAPRRSHTHGPVRCRYFGNESVQPVMTQSDRLFAILRQRSRSTNRGVKQVVAISNLQNSLPQASLPATAACVRASATATRDQVMPCHRAGSLCLPVPSMLTITIPVVEQAQAPKIEIGQPGNVESAAEAVAVG